MCGRFAFVSWAALQDKFGLEGMRDDFRKARYNIAPTQDIAIIPGHRPRSLEWSRWGIGGGHSSLIINARAETVSTKKMFRPLILSRRCLVPADGFYEWEKTGRRKQAYLFSPAGGEVFAFAGLFRVSVGPDGKRSSNCVIITTVANSLVARVHHRMPAIVRERDYEKWLTLSPGSADEMLSLLTPYDALKMKMKMVCDAVNNVRYDGPDCFAPSAQGRLPF